jgi:hypothetical protein
VKWAPLFFACLALVACSRNEASLSERCTSVDAGTPVDPVLLAFLSRARAAHHIADEQESAGELGAAIAPLAALSIGPLPHEGGAALAPEVREVLADTRARLADLHSRQGNYDLALADVRTGLESATEPNYFRGHLLETAGLVEERHAKALEPKDPAGAKAARARAIGLLEQAMAVQAGVIDGAAAPASSQSTGTNPTNTGPNSASARPDSRGGTP